MTGRVISARFPYLPLQLTVRGQTEQVEALLDTGFDGEIVLPAGFVPDEQRHDIYLQWVLADGSRVQAPAYLGTVMVGTFGPFNCVITVLGDEVIVGRSITDRFAVTLDHGMRIIVEQ